MAKRKPRGELEDMDLEYAVKVLNEKIDCSGKSCGSCPIYDDKNLFGVDCGKLVRKAAELVAAEINKPKRTCCGDHSDDLKYQSAIASMKKSGYTHCYMCGASLETDGGGHG